MSAAKHPLLEAPRREARTPSRDFRPGLGAHLATNLLLLLAPKAWKFEDYKLPSIVKTHLLLSQNSTAPFELKLGKMVSTAWWPRGAGGYIYIYIYKYMYL